VNRLRRDDRGSAIVEVHFLGILLLVPLVYIMLAVLDVQRASYGVTQAAREAGRIFVATGDESAARLAARVALTDQGLAAGSADIAFQCSAAPCYQPGAEVTVTVGSTVNIPFLPDVLAGAVNAAIPVEASHSSVVDRFRTL
jgi:Flp pilus assembly protein TadG